MTAQVNSAVNSASNSAATGPRHDAPDRLTGIGVCPGTVVGPVLRLAEPPPEPATGPTVGPAGRAEARERIAVAARAVHDELTARSQRVEGEAADVLRATAMMAADPALAAAAGARVTDDGAPPERAVWDAAGEMADLLRVGGGYLAERAQDVEDVRDRIIAELSGRPAPGIPSPPHPFVLVAHDLAPADTATLDVAKVLAIVIAVGGPTSHTSILARALGIPAVVGVSGAEQLVEGAEVLVDGATGVIVTSPSAEDRERAARARDRARRTFSGHGGTADGHAVALLANVGDPQGARAAAAAGAEGIGLFRTELCFLSRTDPPSVQEQAKVYAEVLEPFAGRRVVVRTLDAGADKPMPFVTGAGEPNPALGVRGLRTSWARPELLADQLEAIALAAGRTGAQVEVMAPMVADADEAAAFVAACAEHGLTAVGVMIEVPAAALLARAVFEHATFASIGTNDLVQYTMAADRQLAPLARLNDPFHPAVLSLVRTTCTAGLDRRRPVGVCGEAAADPALACVLVGLGVGSLSMSPAALPDVAAALLGASLEDCRSAARAATAQASAEAARSAARAVLPHLAEAGL